MLSISWALNSMAQNPTKDLVVGATNNLTPEWQVGYAGPPALTASGAPYQEGSEHLLFDVNSPSGGWYAGGSFALYNYVAQDWSKYTHMRLYWKGFSAANPGNGLRIRLVSSTKAGPWMTVATNSTTSTYQEVIIPIKSFLGGPGPLTSLNSVDHLDFEVTIVEVADPDGAGPLTGWDGQFTGQFYLDNIQVLDWINVKEGSTNIATTGNYDFGNIEIGTSSGAKTFSIENLGTTNLTLSGSPKVSITGADAADFTIVQTGVTSSVAASGSTTFTIAFNPATTGTKSAQISIANDYSVGGSYVINLTGTGVVVPEINVKAATSSISSGGSYDFGSLISGNAGSPVTFTIENTGSAVLNLTGSPRVAISGTNAADFTIDSTSIASPVSVSGSTSVTITFAPSAVGTRTAAITIASDDSNEGTYVINLTGTGTAAPEPEINIKAAAANVASAGSVDFGSSILGTATAATTFTIENVGTADLTLSGTPVVSISGTDAADFTIVQTSSSPVAASGTTSFTISFNPSATGSRTAAITISNNDSDESTYVINLTGTGTTPEINVKAGTSSIASAGSVDFGSSNVGTATSATTFTIENLGTADLTLSGSPAVSISGTDAADFTIVQTSVSSPVAASGTTSFTISFNPSATGSRTAAISISNSDSDEGTYVINLTGTGIAPEINVKAGTSSIASAGSVDFGSSNVGTATSATTFTIENLGTADLTLSGSPAVSISGTNAADFTIVQTSVTSPVAVSGTTSFTISFNPSAAGSRTAAITIANNDLDEGTYVINLTGTGNTVTGIANKAGSDTYEAFPSPFAHEAVIKINSSLDAAISVKVADTKGVIVYTSEDYRTNEEFALGNNLANGIYFVQLTYENRVQIIRIVKMQ
jgi:hypothetical protein